MSPIRQSITSGAGFALTSGVLRVLDAGSEAQLASARELLATLRDTLTQFGASGDDQAALAASMRQLDELFLLVIVGEFNAGKSAFINALLGQVLLQEGVTPTTAQIQVLKYGDTVTRGDRSGRSPGGDGAGRAAARRPHRRHPRDERDHPRARAAHHRVRPTVRPGPLHHLGRSSVHRNGAALPRNHPRLGEEDRHRRQQGGHLQHGVRARGSARVREECRAGPARIRSRRAAGERAPCAKGQAGRTVAVGDEPLRGAGAVSARHPRCAEPLPSEAGQPAGRGPGAREPVRDDSRRSDSR